MVVGLPRNHLSSAQLTTSRQTQHCNIDFPLLQRETRLAVSAEAQNRTTTQRTHDL